MVYWSVHDRIANNDLLANVPQSRVETVYFIAQIQLDTVNKYYPTLWYSKLQLLEVRCLVFELCINCDE
jgi:hypothetical protein